MKDNKIFLKYIICVIMAGIFWGTAGMFVTKLSQLGFSKIQIASARCICAGVSSVVFIIITNPKKLRINLKQLLVCMFIGFSFFFMAYFYYVAMQFSSCSVASVLLDMAALPVLFFSVLFLKEKLTLKKSIAVLIALIGCTFVTGVITGASYNLYGIGMAFLSCLCYASYSILTKIAVKMKTDTTTIIVYCFIFAALISLFFGKPVSSVKLTLECPWYTILLLVGIGIFTGSLPGYLYTSAMTKIPVGIVSSVACVEPLASTVFAILFLGERLSVITVIGIAMILISITIIAKQTE